MHSTSLPSTSNLSILFSLLTAFVEEAKDKDQGKRCLRNAALDSCDSRLSLTLPRLVCVSYSFVVTFLDDSCCSLASRFRLCVSSACLLPLCLDSCTLLIVDLEIAAAAIDARSAE